MTSCVSDFQLEPQSAELLAQEERFAAVLKEYELKCRVRAPLCLPCSLMSRLWVSTCRWFTRMQEFLLQGEPLLAAVLDHGLATLLDLGFPGSRCHLS